MWYNLKISYVNAILK